MTLLEKIGVKRSLVDVNTGEEIKSSDVYARAIDALGGLDAVIPYIPFDVSMIRLALYTDKNLNNLPAASWNKASGFICDDMNCTFVGGGIWELYRKVGISAANNADSVCVLKEAVRQWAKRKDN